MIGKTISHYRLTEFLDAGGMGEVYRAEDLKLERDIAVKVLKPATSKPGAIKRFMREARIMSRIRHPNVVTVHDIVEEGGTHFLIMEYIDGPVLRKYLADGTLDSREAVRIASEVGAALAAAHEQGVIHRDVKPENIMMTKSGSCRVLDFGVAHLADATRITTEGKVLGTAHYMAPEQLKGSDVDERSDVHALGVLLFEMLAGRRPFVADEWEALAYMIVNVKPPWLREVAPGVPRDVEAVVRKALAKDPVNRYQSMNEMLHDLEVVASRLDAREKSGRISAHTRRWRRVVTWGSVGASILVAVAMWRLFVPARSPTPRIMVMRVVNSLADEDLAFLSGGIMDGLISRLARLAGYNIIARATVTSMIDATGLQLAGFDPSDVIEAADRVGADYLVMASFARSGYAIRVNCTLSDVGSGVLIGSWSKNMVDLNTDFYPVIERFGTDIAAALGAGWREEPEYVPGPITPSMDALEQYELALTAEEGGDVGEALARLRAAVAFDSTFTEAHLVLSRLSPDYSEKQNSLTMAMMYRLRASTTVRQLVEAEHLVFNGGYEPAIGVYESILAVDPEHVDARQRLAWLYRRTRRFDAAASEYSVLQRISPMDHSFYREWAMSYTEIGKRDRALELIAEWRKEFPASDPPLREYLRACERLGNYREGVTLCDSLWRSNPDEQPFVCAWLLDYVGRLSDAERIYGRLIESPDPAMVESRGYAYMAYVSFRREQYERGLAYMDKAFEDQEETYYHWLAGLIAAGAGQIDRAMRHAEWIAREIEPLPDGAPPVEAVGLRRFYNHLRGCIEMNAEQPAQAVTFFEEALEYVSPLDDPYFRTYLAMALAESGELDDAVRQFERVLAVNPENGQALLNLGRTYILKRDYGRSGDVLARMKELWRDADPDDPWNVELNHLIEVSAAHQ